MQKISSKDNNLIKHIKKLKERKYRQEFNEYIVEGTRLIQEAIQENARIKQIIICDECFKDEIIDESLRYKIAKKECYCVPENIFKLLTEVEKPQGILAVIEKEENKELEECKDEIFIALDNLQDPGNLGTILRTADSANIKKILVSKGTVDCYSPKVVRSTMGAIFRVEVIECENLQKTLEILKNKGYNIIVTSLDAKNTIYDVNYSKSVIVIGNEANGVSNKIKDIANKKVIIPMLGKTESLNASVATGIIIYEYVRQKIKK